MAARIHFDVYFVENAAALASHSRSLFLSLSLFRFVQNEVLSNLAEVNRVNSGKVVKCVCLALSLSLCVCDTFDQNKI